MNVTPFTGVWIETSCNVGLKEKKKSHPLRVCGLKLGLEETKRKCRQVTPFTGVWIETSEGQ